MTPISSGLGRIPLVCVLCALPIFTSPAVLASEWQFEAGVSSRLMRRGISISEGGTIDVRASSYLGSGWFFGLSGMNIKAMQDGRPGLQVIADIGYGWPVAPNLDAQLTLSHYGLFGDSASKRFEYDDLSLTLAYRDMVFVSVTGSPNTAPSTMNGQNGRSSVVSHDLILRYPVFRGWSVNGGVGYSDWHGPDADYLYGHIGLNGRFQEWQASMTRIATGSTAKRRYGEPAANRWVVGVRRHF